MEFLVRFYKVESGDRLTPTDENKLVDLSKTTLIDTRSYPCLENQKMSIIIDKIQQDLKEYKSSSPLKKGEDIIQLIEFKL